MADYQKMRWCSSCDVYVGMFRGDMVVVTGDAFRMWLGGYYDFQGDVADMAIYEPDAWFEWAADECDVSAWFEPDESRKSWEWYRGRSLEESHDHFIWLELVS